MTLVGLMQVEPTSILPAGETWWDRYGAVGVVAFLALTALVIGLRLYIIDKRVEAKRCEDEKVDLRRMIQLKDDAIIELNQDMVEQAQQQHEETMRLLAEQAETHERRYQELFNRHITGTERSAEKQQELAAVVARAMDSLSRKLRDGG